MNVPSVNRLAWKLVEKLREKSELYNVHVEKLSSGTTIIDAGIKAKGGFQAGKIITEICMGGCGKARITCENYGETKLPSIFVYTDNPVIATLGSQFAGWQIKEGDYFAIGSGPARALSLKPKEIYEKIGYRDDYDRAVVVLETDKYPPQSLIDRFVKECKVSHENLAVVLTPTASLAGATQVSGRIVETGIHKLSKVGLDPNKILYAWGHAPISPLHPKFTIAMARTNDAILYGGVTYYVVDYENEEEPLDGGNCTSIMGIIVIVWLTVNRRILSECFDSYRTRNREMAKVSALRKRLDDLREEKRLLESTATENEVVVRNRFRMVKPGEHLVLVEREEP